MFLTDGVIEGRKTFGNLLKYIKIAVSSNFGEVISVMIASLLLPFFSINANSTFLVQKFTL